jgi:hypothetical protein
VEKRAWRCGAGAATRVATAAIAAMRATSKARRLSLDCTPESLRRLTLWLYGHGGTSSSSASRARRRSSTVWCHAALTILQRLREAG